MPSVSAIRLSDAFGKDLEDIIAGTPVTVKSTVYNQSTEDVDILLMLAEYDGRGQLLNTVLGQHRIHMGEKTDIMGYIKAKEETKSIKVFVWRDLLIVLASIAFGRPNASC